MKRVIKLGIISAVVFFVILYLMSLLLPSHVRISRAINIDGTKEQIMPFVADTAKWRLWNELAIDSIEVKKLVANADRVSTSWHFRGRTINSSFSLEESANVTVVQWYFDFRLKWYPWEKFGSITFDKRFGGPMESSLNNLKKLIENSP